MSLTTTRISDLPDKSSIQMPLNTFNQNNSDGGGRGGSNTRSGGDMGMNSQKQQQELGGNTYIPINNHANPYGYPEQNSGGGFPTMNMREEPDAIKKGFREYGGNGDSGSIEHRLPSRDIPQGNSDYMHDEEVHANYIPKKNTSDYIREFEETEEKYIKKHENNKKRSIQADDFMTLIQAPLLVACIFFLFHLEALNSIIYKYGSFLGIYKSDGCMNLRGLILKSVMFGTTYFGINETITYLSNI